MKETDFHGEAKIGTHNDEYRMGSISRWCLNFLEQLNKRGESSYHKAGGSRNTPYNNAPGAGTEPDCLEPKITRPEGPSELTYIINNSEIVVSQN